MIKITSPIDRVDSSAGFTVGSRTETKEGNEYIYLPGTTSVAQYDWVVYKTTGSGLSYGSVTRLLANGANAGPMAIAQGAIVSNKFGWFQVKGVGWGNCGDTASAGSPCYSSGTLATVTTTVASTHGIYGAIAIGTGASGGTVKVFINYPQIYAQTL